MTIVSAFPIAGGIQINREMPDGSLDCLHLFPGDEGYEEAAAAAGHFAEPEIVSPPSIESLRNHASLSRSEFLLRCVAAEILSEAEALEAAGGAIPASFASAIDDWSPEQRFEARLRWAALIQVDRNNPLILMLAADREIPPAALDMIFGISTNIEDI